MIDAADMHRLAELDRVVGDFTRADYDLVRRRLSQIRDERARLEALEALIRVQMNLAPPAPSP